MIRAADDEYTQTVSDQSAARRSGCCGGLPQPRTAAVTAVGSDTGRAADVRNGAGHRPAGVGEHVRRSRTPRAGDDEPGRASNGSGELAADDGTACRTACRTAQGDARRDDA